MHQNKGDVKDFKVYLLTIGGGEFNVFIKDVSSVSDYVRLTFGYTEMRHGKRTARILQRWVTEPKGASGTFLGRFDGRSMKGRRLWIVFETVRRQKGKRGQALEHFAGISPSSSTWRQSVGVETPFELKKIDIEEYRRLGQQYALEAGHNQSVD